jgi:enoyl-CoA hydratase/carnithine racemase
MINGITTEFGEVLFDGARVSASDMIGAPGEGWRLAMIVVSHEREPGELGYVARYKKLVEELTRTVRDHPERYGPEQVRELGWAVVEAEMLRLHVCRRLSDRLDGISHGPEGSVDKLLMTQVEQAVGHAALAVGGAGHGGGDDTWLKVYLYSRAQSVMGGTSDPAHLVAGRILELPTLMRNDMTYDLPDSLQVEVDGPVRVVRLNRPEQLNATNHELHAGLAALFPQLDADRDARAAVITGNGRAFSAGGDFGYLGELANDAELRHESLTHGRQIVTGMVACRVPIVAAVNGPAVGLGCSIVALSDIVYMAESAHLADPHVLVGLVAADGGPITWPLLTSLQLAKEYALTGERIPAPRAAQIGLVNHVCPDDEVVDQALACARRIAELPQRAAEDTKRILNMHLERAVLATLDFALTAEDRSFTSPELRANIDRLLSRDT